MSPLDTPLTFRWPLSEAFAAKRGLRGLGSVRRADFGTLLCPEFPLRSSPRITVRGQTVQGGRVLLRKAPLPSRVYPWSTRRPCGPLAFRCATEGSRSAKEGKGSQEGTGNHTWCPVPFCPPPWVRRLRRQTAALPAARRRQFSLRRGHGVFSAARRRRLRAAFGGNSYDGRQFPSLTQVVSLSLTIVTIYPFLPKLSATIRPSAVWKI